ncbi:protein-tyrosine-phosphatase [Planotetraspora thailandica]|uniref:Protein-tyrosine-phosphatase n=1 Tax=Planotetraspora thailandica TaxID=487172 RepID=A0A8J3V4D0_9ACTN|nr:protein-tyrosine phosphatase family protein [Planotetraspora thailandica]GII54781.1 protein-tyrosine-phosphatase [Planotetraspora thailandica]
MTALLTGAIQIPDGAWIRGRGLRDPTPTGPVPDFALYLGTSLLRRRHEAALTWPHEWVAWPDFLLPLDRQAAARSITRLHDLARAGRNVEVACNGGIGRTGTVMACLAVRAGLSPDEAVGWVREHHHRRAVETPWQRRWVAWFAVHTGS